MTRNEMNIALAAVITTLAEIKGEVPLSHLYAAMMGRYSLSDFHEVLSVLIHGNCIDSARYVVCITETGEKLAAAINASITTH